MAESIHERMMRLHPQDDKSEQPGLLKYDIALKSKKRIAEDTWLFTFEKPQGFHFTAGQHLRMTLIDPPETDKEGNSRFWSIASTPANPDLLIAMRMRSTAFKRVLSTLPLGTRVRIQVRKHAHKNAFVLHEDSSRPAVFLVGGIGIVPAYAMIRDALERQLPYQIVLFYSNRRPEDAPFLAELKKLAKQHTNFTFIPTMTALDQSTKRWTGHVGRIDVALLKTYVLDIKAPTYYIAGLPALVNAMQCLLTELGVDNSTIRSEEYGGFNVNHSGPTPARRSKIVVIGVGIAVVAMVGAHVLAASTMMNAVHHVKFQLTLVLLLMLAGGFIVKFRFIRKHMQSKQK